ncbi:hypothetical protein IPC1622_15470 [Pseudomonas aeruginosa]|uniref:hypothetical protein n=1 Tax=Pseudomonas aeruginosa TaxID=287 RepID=UPI000F879E3D|nr:hypothetical protein [Pseudomonas aeruginosa]MCQ9819278.1 hypothetical protein [Pseudomonas aeruginosa]RUA49468.1 hypothetical protein IPC1622_15470 [Pseudomonas aeruginosa]
MIRRPKLRNSICGVVLTTMATGVFAIGPGEMGDLKQRYEEGGSANTSDEVIDVRNVSGDWQVNQARAKVKYDQPHYYVGKLKRVALRNDSDADLVLDAGNGREITAILFPYQFGPWEKRKDGKLIPKGGVTTMEFAAYFDAGQRFNLHCKQALPVMLMDCLAMPVEMAR